MVADGFDAGSRTIVRATVMTVPTMPKKARCSAVPMRKMATV
jgi:hypothetical protein